jgi:steroid delta-isomerase-like uncharacterized protein
MSTEENKAISRSFCEALGNGDLDTMMQSLASNVVVHGLPGLPPGREAFKGVVAMFLVAFPDAKITVEDQIAEGDTVVTRYTFCGTHQGELQGIEPTGKQVTFTGITTDCIAGGKIAEHRDIFDQLGMLQQLGAIPTPGQAAE